jgi:hypothetical protein
MGRLTEDMGRLRDDIVSQHMARRTLIADTRQEVTDAAQAFMSDLKDTVETLQANFHEAHAEMAQAGRADRHAFLTQLGGAVADLRVAATNRQANVREAFAAMTAEARSEREQAADVLRQEVAQLQDGFRHSRGVMGMEVRAAGQSFVADIVGAVADMQRQTLQMVGGFAGERASARQAWQGGSTQPVAAPAPAKPKAQPKTALKAQPKAAAPKPAARPVVKPMEKPVDKPVVNDAQGPGKGADPE